MCQHWHSYPGENRVMTRNYETSVGTQKGSERSSYEDLRSVGPMSRLPRRSKPTGTRGWDPIAAEAAVANG